MPEDNSKLMKAAVGHTLANSELQSTQEYLQRGRVYQKLASPELRAMFVEAFKERVGHLRDPDACTRLNDLQAEYSLRGVEPPFEDVKGDFEKLLRAAEEMFQELTPEREEEIGKEIIEEYLTGRRREN